MVTEDIIGMKLDKEQSEHRFESVSYILDLYKGKLIEKLQGKLKGCYSTRAGWCCPQGVCENFER